MTTLSLAKPFFTSISFSLGVSCNEGGRILLTGNRWTDTKDRRKLVSVEKAVLGICRDRVLKEKTVQRILRRKRRHSALAHGTAIRNYWFIVQRQTRYIIRRCGWASVSCSRNHYLTSAYSAARRTKRVECLVEWKKVEETVLLSRASCCNEKIDAWHEKIVSQPERRIFT